jgi:hypothetical protein
MHVYLLEECLPIEYIIEFSELKWQNTSMELNVLKNRRCGTTCLTSWCFLIWISASNTLDTLSGDFPNNFSKC